MQQPKPFEIDISTQRNCSVYTSGTAFFENVLANVNKDSVVRIITYNVGINIGVGFLYNIIKQLAKCYQVKLLVGHDPHHQKNAEIQAELVAYLKLAKNLEVRIQEKQHGKLIIVETVPSNRFIYTIRGWTGSLNFINPTLADIMVELSTMQSVLLKAHFETQWLLGKPFTGLVHLMNRTPLALRAPGSFEDHHTKD